MADEFNFSKNVPDVRSTVALPVVKRNVNVQTTSTPEFQSTTEALAESQNNLSAIGAKVAQTASNQMSTQLGYEQGKTPVGDLMPSLTEFDKNFENSYHTQAQATLGLQGQKLLLDSEVEMSKPNRLTPELIARTNAQVQLGLNKIAANAPTAIKGQLQANFDSQVLRQNNQYKQKMIGEQREDQKNTIINALDLNTKNALELATSGDINGAERLVEQSKKMADSAAESRFLTPEQARTAHESVTQAALDGKYTNLAMQAMNQGKYAEFEKKYSENKPSGMTNEQWMSTGKAFSSQIAFLQGLHQQDENLKAQQMLNAIASDVGSITGTQLKAFEDSVSPLKYEEVKFRYIQAYKRNAESTEAVDSLIQNFSNPESWANATEKVKNSAFNKSVNYSVQNSHKVTVPLRAPAPLTHEEAEVQVAATAPTQIPVFTNGLKNKLSSANPAFIESAAQQIHALQAMGAGHALAGLSDQDKAAYTKYEALRDSMQPTDAAREMTNIVYNQDPAVETMNKQKWSNYLSKATTGGVSLHDFALMSFHLKESDFINPSMSQVYATNILSKYSSFYQALNGDDVSAKKLTQQYIKENYGNTGVNGGSFKTLHPLEMVLGFHDTGAVPYIQQDVINQLNEKLLPVKEAYANKTTNVYWETVPLSGKEHGIFTTTYDPVKIKRHMRTGDTEKVDTYNVILQGNAFDNWDVAIQTESGMRNLFQFAPYLGIISYSPNKKAIHESYNKNHPLK